jgi:hypothetical protein
MNTRLRTVTALFARYEDMWPAKGLRLGRRRGNVQEVGFVFDPGDEVLGVPVREVDGQLKLHRF